MPRPTGPSRTRRPGPAGAPPRFGAAAAMLLAVAWLSVLPALHAGAHAHHAGRAEHAAAPHAHPCASCAHAAPGAAAAPRAGAHGGPARSAPAPDDPCDNGDGCSVCALVSAAKAGVPLAGVLRAVGGAGDARIAATPDVRSAPLCLAPSARSSRGPPAAAARF